MLNDQYKRNEEGKWNMNIIVCLDEKGGMLFNHRRQSADRTVRERILALCAGKKLWMNHYSAAQFASSDVPEIQVEDEFLGKAQAGEYCFVEDAALLPYEERIESIVVFQWNRVYPADVHFDLPLLEQGWKCQRTEDFAGNSHERITMEVYKR